MSFLVLLTFRAGIMWIHPYFICVHKHNRLQAVKPNFLLYADDFCLLFHFKNFVYKLSHELPNDLKLSILGN